MTTITTATKPRSAPIKQVLAKRPILSFFVLVFVFTWLLDLPMVLGQDGLGIFSYSVPLPLYVVLFILGAYGPSLAAILITSVIEGRQGVRDFFRRYRQWRFGFRWYLFVLFAFPLIYLVAAGVWLGLEAMRAAVTQWQAYLTIYLPALLIFPALITWGEEPGWRGFALTRLQLRYSPLLSTLLVGFLHALWHLPIFLLVNGPVASGPFDLMNFVINSLGIMAVSIIFTWGFNNTQLSILMAVLMHASFNASQAYTGTIIDPYPEEAAYTALVIILAVGLVLIAVTKGRLAYPSSPVERNEG